MNSLYPFSRIRDCSKSACGFAQRFENVQHDALQYHSKGREITRVPEGIHNAVNGVISNDEFGLKSAAITISPCGISILKEALP